MSNEQLWKTHDNLTYFKHCDCGCILRGDGETLRYCGPHNPKRGTKVFKVESA